MKTRFGIHAFRTVVGILIVLSWEASLHSTPSLASLPPRLLSPLSSAPGVHYWPTSASRVRWLAGRFGTTRIEYLLDEWEDGNPNIIPNAKAYANAAQKSDSWLILELKGSGPGKFSPNLSTRYASFCGSMAQELWSAGFRNVVFELWNEPNISGFDSAASYATVANAAAAAIGAVSDFPVCSGGVSEPVTSLIPSSDWRVQIISLLDWSNIHFYGFHAYTTTPDHQQTTNITVDDIIAYMRSLLAPYGRDVLMTEMSWSRNEFSEDKRTAFYARLGLVYIRNAVESAVWFDDFGDPSNPDPCQLPQDAFGAAWGINWAFPGNPKRYTTTTGDASFVGVGVSGISSLQSVARKYDAIGALHLALWRDVPYATSTQYGVLTIPSGYVCANYVQVQDPYNTLVDCPINGGQISGVHVSGTPILLFLRKTHYWADLYDGPFGYVYPAISNPVSLDQICDHAMSSGQTETFRLEVVNLGNATWTNSGDAAIYVRLKGADAELFRAPDWLPPDPSDPGVSIPARIKDASVPTGATTTLEWTMKAPQVTQTTTFGLNNALAVGIYGKGAYYPSDVCNVANIGYYNITVQPGVANSPPSAPTNQQPTNGATGVSLSPSLAASAFSDPDAGDTHGASQWQITNAPGAYASPNLVWDSGSDSQHLTSVTVPGALLQPNTRYWWHVRYRDSAVTSNWSAYSSETNFTTSGGNWKGLAMLSLPLTPGSTDPKQVVGFDGSAWYAYNPLTHAYAGYSDHYSWFEPVGSARGRGFWARFAGEVPLPTGSIPAQDQPYAIHLYAGWNLIGNPFVPGVTWDLTSIKVQETGGVAKSLKDARDVIYPYAWGWKQNASNPNTGSYDLVYDSSVMPGVTNRLEPWQGYWVRARKECNLILPAPEHISLYSDNGERTASIAESVSDFTLSYEVDVKRREGSVYFRLSPDSANGYGVVFSPFASQGGNVGMFLVKRTGDVESFLDWAEYGVPRQNGLARFNIQAQGSSLLVSENDKVVLQAADDSFKTGRLVWRVYGDQTNPAEAAFLSIRFERM